MSEILVAIVGAISSVLVAWITSRKAEKSKSISSSTPFLSMLALGLAVTAIAIGVFSFSESQKIQFKTVKTKVTAHTNGSRGESGTTHLIAPNVPSNPEVHELNLSCPIGYTPIEAWHEVTGSYPSADAMYTINASVNGEKAFIALRAREGAVGYSYVEVIVLCFRT